MIEVIEFTDPGCSWAWGTEPKLRMLQWQYGDRLKWRRVLGGLVGDMGSFVKGEFNPERMAVTYTQYWRDVCRHTGMPFPVNLRWMYRSTEPGGKAVKAAEQQSDVIGGRVLRRLREATFVFGTPPDTTDRILEAVRGTEGLDMARFELDLDSEATERAFQEDWEETRKPNDFVMTLKEDTPGAGNAKHTEGHWRYVFPTLVFQTDKGHMTVPGWKPYDRYVEAMERALPGSTDGGKDRPSPEEAFKWWGTLAPAELEFLCGTTAKPPKGLVTYNWGEGNFYLTHEEAEGRGLL